jgi:hypothetical protein
MSEELERRSRLLFADSVERVDMRVRSRLTRARHAALEAAAKRGPRFFGLPLWTPAAGVTAAAVLGAALWFAPQMGNRSVPAADGPAYEDLDIVASSDGLDLLQDDPEFYDWAAAATSDSGSVS